MRPRERRRLNRQRGLNQEPWLGRGCAYFDSFAGCSRTCLKRALEQTAVTASGGRSQRIGWERRRKRRASTVSSTAADA